MLLGLLKFLHPRSSWAAFFFVKEMALGAILPGVSSWKQKFKFTAQLRAGAPESLCSMKTWGYYLFASGFGVTMLLSRPICIYISISWLRTSSPDPSEAAGDSSGVTMGYLGSIGGCWSLLITLSTTFGHGMFFLQGMMMYLAQLTLPIWLLL